MQLASSAANIAKALQLQFIVEWTTDFLNDCKAVQNLNVHSIQQIYFKGLCLEFYIYLQDKTIHDMPCLQLKAILKVWMF